MTETGILNLFSTTTVFGTPLDVTVSEIAIESFFPADEKPLTLSNRTAFSGPTVLPIVQRQL